MYKRTNLGNIYLENKYIIITNVEKVKTIWLIKKKGTNCGINKKITLIYSYTYFYKES
jgi:hypothetical protein